MAILKNLDFKEKDLVTQWGKLHFDKNGEVEVNDEVGKKLSTLKGFSVEAEEESGNNSDDEENSQENENETPEDEESEKEVETDSEESEDDTTEDDAEAETEDEESEEEVEETTTYTEKELEEKTVPQLRKIAKDMGLAISSDAKKKQIIDAILG